jgi:hypothetical protein
MTSRERMATAMALDVPDRVPVMCQMSIGHMLLQTGLRPAAFWHSPDVFAEGLIRMARLYGFDGILISLHGHDAEWEKQVLRTESAETGETVFWKNGDRTRFPVDDLPLHEPASPRRPPELRVFRPETLAESIAFIPVSQGLEFRFVPGRELEIFRLVRRLAGPGLSVHGEVTSPFDYFLHFFGFEQALFGLVEHPEICRAVLRRFAEGVAALAAAQASLGVLDAIKISSPFAGAGFISPAFYRDFVMPFEGLVARAVKAQGLPVYTHTCGDIHDRLELMADSGVSGIECLDPPPLGRTDLADAKRRVGARIFIKGNIDPVHTLLRGSQADVRADARRRLAVGSPGGGFILSSACAIAPRTPPENIAVLVEEAEAAA